jgi:hypothetical protein
LFFLVIITYSCNDCKYNINKEYISCSCKFDQGFYFQEIKVDSIDETGFPVLFTVLKQIDLFYLKDSPSKNRIYFKKTNNGYKWVDTKNNGIAYDTLPIIFENGKIYKIRGLVFRGQPDRAAFLYFKNDSLKVRGYSESTSW